MHRCDLRVRKVRLGGFKLTRICNFLMTSACTMVLDDYDIRTGDANAGTR